jgi:hypothetical protein
MCAFIAIFEGFGDSNAQRDVFGTSPNFPRLWRLNTPDLFATHHNRLCPHLAFSTRSGACFKDYLHRRN